MLELAFITIETNNVQCQKSVIILIQWRRHFMNCALIPKNCIFQIKSLEGNTEKFFFVYVYPFWKLGRKLKLKSKVVFTVLIYTSSKTLTLHLLTSWSRIMFYKIKNKLVFTFLIKYKNPKVYCLLTVRLKYWIDW